MTAQYKSLLLPERLGSLQTALEAAVAAQRGMRVRVIAFPGTPFSSPHQCSVFLRGDAPLTARLFTPVLVDAQTAKVTDSCALPWYVTALLLSQPLHFGDYGGVAMQILWALLDIATVAMLGSGLFFWLRRRLCNLAKTGAERPNTRRFLVPARSRE